jgi:hypothetical protein
MSEPSPPPVPKQGTDPLTVFDPAKVKPDLRGSGRRDFAHPAPRIALLTRPRWWAHREGGAKQWLARWLTSWSRR